MKKHNPWVKSEREFYKKMFHNLVKGLDLSKPLLVLDYGSGTGGFSSLLAEFNPNIKITAVDSNPKAINLAKKHYDHLPNLEFIVSNEIPNRNYDIIFGNLVLHELNNRGDKKTIKSFLERSYENLKEKGLISILDTHKISKKDFQKIRLENNNPYKGNLEHEYKEHNKYEIKDWIKMFKDAGFDSEHSQTHHPNFFHYRGKK